MDKEIWYEFATYALLIHSALIFMALLLNAAGNFVRNHREEWRFAIHLWACERINRRDERNLKAAERKLRKVSFAKSRKLCSTLPAARRLRSQR